MSVWECDATMGPHDLRTIPSMIVGSGSRECSGYGHICCYISYNVKQDRQECAACSIIINVGAPYEDNYTHKSGQHSYEETKTPWTEPCYSLNCNGTWEWHQVDCKKCGYYYTYRLVDGSTHNH